MKRLCVAGLLLCAGSLFAVGARAQDQADLAKAGFKIYDNNCAQCHGDRLVGSGITFDLRRLKADERPRFENSVLNGKNQMPPWRNVLKPADLDAIWAYIRANANE